MSQFLCQDISENLLAGTQREEDPKPLCSDGKRLLLADQKDTPQESDNKYFVKEPIIFLHEKKPTFILRPLLKNHLL